MKSKYLFGLVLLFVMACSSSEEDSSQSNEVKTKKMEIGGKPVSALRHIIIYKTRYNHYHSVPVLLNAEKTEVVGYPAKEDLLMGDGFFALPLQLEDGWLLDRRGISKNSAFLAISYTEYYQNDILSTKAMYDAIADKDPFLEIYDCGLPSEYKQLELELNILLKKKDYSKFKKIK